jgi:prepilin peptidase CpaA
VGWAAVTDVRARRIPNWLTLSVVLSGIAQSLTSWSLISPSQSILGLGTGFALTFLMYIIGGRGAGDVKLTAGIGAWLGPSAVLGVFVVAALVSLISSVVQSFFAGRLLALFRSAGLMLLMIVTSRGRRGGGRSLIEDLRGWPSIGRPLPNGVSTAVATLMVVLWLGLKSKA